MIYRLKIIKSDEEEAFVNAVEYFLSKISKLVEVKFQRNLYYAQAGCEEILEAGGVKTLHENLVAFILYKE